MSKLEKKKEKLKQRIADLEFEMRNILQKKSQGAAINIQNYNSKIMDLKKELSSMN